MKWNDGGGGGEEEEEEDGVFHLVLFRWLTY
jgi:hypothetical protein